MSEVYYTSDLHLYHRLVAGLRGFETPGEHNEHLAAKWDSMVKPDDQVWILGDLSINGHQFALDWVAERPGRKHLITGNHDPVGPHDRRAANKMKHWMGYFDSIQSLARRKLVGREFLLSHYPYWSYGDGPERPTARNEQFRTPELGLPLLHGHTHGTEREHGLMLHVGWDAWGELVPQQKVIDFLLALPPVNV